LAERAYRASPPKTHRAAPTDLELAHGGEATSSLASLPSASSSRAIKQNAIRLLASMMWHFAPLIANTSNCWA
jgi:hypothetical protein